jgi:hypothetical protein
MESRGGWNKLKTQNKTKRYQALTAIDKCISVTPSIKVQILENMYEMVCESKIMYEIEVWRLDEAWEEIDKIHSRFGKKLLDILSYAVHGFADISMSEQERKGHRMDCKILVSYYVSGYEGAVQQCYKWQKSVRS